MVNTKIVQGHIMMIMMIMMMMMAMNLPTWKCLLPIFIEHYIPL